MAVLASSFLVVLQFGVLLSVTVQAHDSATTTNGNASTSANAASSPHQESVDFGMVDWLRFKGGYFNDKQVIRRLDPDDPTSIVGIFAVEEIKQGELLLQVPWDCIITLEDDYEPIDEDLEDQTALECGTARHLAKEMLLGKDSSYAPYVLYLLNQPTGQVSSAWSPQGKELLQLLLGGTPNEPRIPPVAAMIWIDEDWYYHCNGDPDDDFATQAAMLVLQRADDDLMVPIYDLYNHRNGRYHNTISKINRDVSHEMRAKQNIQAGEQVHNSYNLCAGCDGRWSDYGTSHIFKDYGFVELYPQRWVLYDPHIEFDLHEIEEEDGKVRYELEWNPIYRPHNASPHRRSLMVVRLKSEIKRLHQLRQTIVRDPDIRDHEWNQVWEYQEAVIRAFAMAINDMVGKEEDKVPIWYPPGGVCSLHNSSSSGCIGDHYDNLKALKDDEDKSMYRYSTEECNTAEIDSQFDDYEVISQVNSSYQQLTFEGRTLSDKEDICLTLDDTLQICSCYRPHYHEFFVHYPARYLDQVKRVLFVGGGDSMLLHEILKYPSLEKVVGLELDLVVTQTSLQYFHTQPHFDDSRVEWWFGDASGTLELLPRDYWGSFDLVLVDLSETTVASFDTVALLLKPEGILVKNEMYLPAMAKTFEHTIQIAFTSPKVCHQILSLGSQSVDFLHTPLGGNHHGSMATLVLPPQMTEETANDRYKYIHDYRKRKIRKTTRQRQAEGAPPSSVLVIVNAEDISGDWATLPITLSLAVTEIGLTVLGGQSWSGASANILLREGYIQLQYWPEKGSVALDVLLWSKLDLLDKLEQALRQGLRSKSLSSFRLVVDGMSGTEDDYASPRIGPQSAISKSDECAANVESLSKSSSPPTLPVLAAHVKEIFFTDDKSVHVGLIQDAPDAETVRALETTGFSVQTFATCPGILGAKDPVSKATAMYACEESIALQLQESSKPDLLLLDTTVPLEMGQIWHSVVTRSANRHAIFHNDTTTMRKFAILTVGNHNAPWQSNFLDRCRRQVGDDPIFLGQLKVGGGVGNVGLLVSGDESFVAHLIQLETKLGGDAEIESILGGLSSSGAPHELLGSQEFQPQHYDRQAAARQLTNQVVLARQTVAQFIVGRTPRVTSVQDVLLLCLKELNWIPAVDDGDSGVLRVVSGSDIDGTGAMFASTFSKGSLMVVWDGKNSLIVNLILLIADGDAQTNADRFLLSLSKHLGRFEAQLQLRNDIPRGTGRVVTFP